MDVLSDLESQILSPTLLHALGIPSASIAVLSDGKISSRVITSGSENADTLYQACSISKAITGLAVAKLVEQGLLSYSTPIADHLPQEIIEVLVEKETAHLLPHVTVGMLLSHTAGLSQGGFPGYEDQPPSAETVLSGKSPSNTPRVTFLTFPGAQFSYSGGGFTVLQVFLENLLDKPFAQAMQHLLFEPLGMTRSFFGALPESELDYAAAHFTAHTRSRAGYHSLPELAAAGLWTTPSDLLKAIAAIQTSLHSHDGFITQETAKRMLEPLLPAFAADDYMAHGWFVTETAFGHAGSNDPGYRCYVLGSHGGSIATPSPVKPDSTGKLGNRGGVPWGKSEGLAVMTNSALGWPACVRILSAVSYLKAWLSFPSLPSLPPAPEWVPCVAPTGTPFEGGWDAWVGEWEDGWTLQARDGLPVWGFRDMAVMELRPAAAPVRVLDDGRKETCLVVVGLDMAVNLAWEGEERVIRWFQAKGKVLKRI